jgi:hypothetical protein
MAAGSRNGSYPGTVVNELLDEAGCDTLNLRILWEDRVSSLLYVLK